MAENSFFPATARISTFNGDIATRIDYCQFLLSTQINFTNTYYADHSREFCHDAVDRLLANAKMTSAMIWQHVEGDIAPSAHGCIVFDDAVLDKNHSRSIEMVHRQYSGNAHGVIKGLAKAWSSTAC